MTSGIRIRGHPWKAQHFRSNTPTWVSRENATTRREKDPDEAEDYSLMPPDVGADKK